MDFSELAARVQLLEDERELRELVSRYGHYADLGFEDAYVDMWTDDGVYDIVTIKRNGAGYDGAIRFEGKTELYEEIRDPRAHKQFEGRCLHLQDLNLVITLAGDRATAESYSMTILREGEETVIRTAGMNRWTFRREDGRWKIAEKRRRPMGDKALFEGIDAASVQRLSAP